MRAHGSVVCVLVAVVVLFAMKVSAAPQTAFTMAFGQGNNNYLMSTFETAAGLIGMVGYGPGFPGTAATGEDMWLILVDADGVHQWEGAYGMCSVFILVDLLVDFIYILVG
jgi:hypothetical protein